VVCCPSLNGKNDARTPIKRMHPTADTAAVKFLNRAARRVMRSVMCLKEVL
jgi:hypothetical protein